MEKVSYDRRVYESVDDKSLFSLISQSLKETSFRQ